MGEREDRGRRRSNGAMGSRQGKGREKELQEVNLLSLSPLRLAEWEGGGSRVTVIRPPPRTGGIRGVLDRLLHALSTRRIRLDEVGSFAWTRFDGHNTVGEIGDLLRAEFGDRVEPVEERLGHLVWLLRREGLLAYPGWDEEA